jgi:hypothetical protein
MFEDIFDIVGLETIVHSNGDGSGCCNAKDGLEKCGCVRAQDTDTLESVFAQIEGEPSCPIGGLNVGATEYAVVRCYMIDGCGLQEKIH